MARLRHGIRDNRMIYRKAPDFEWAYKVTPANPKPSPLKDIKDFEEDYNDWVLSRDPLWTIALEIMVDFNYEHNDAFARYAYLNIFGGSKILP